MLLALSGGPAEDICLTHCPCSNPVLCSPPARGMQCTGMFRAMQWFGVPWGSQAVLPPSQGAITWASCKHPQPSSLLQGLVPQRCLFGEFMSPHSSWRSSMTRLNPLAG